jgi:hypothetical protein
MSRRFLATHVTIRCRSAFLSERIATLESAGWGTAWIMWSAKLLAAHKSPSGVAGEIISYVSGSRQEQTVRWKSCSGYGVSLMSCWRHLDGLRSPISSARNWHMHCSLEGQTRHQFGFQRDVGVSFRQRDDILYFRGEPLV